MPDLALTPDDPVRLVDQAGRRARVAQRQLARASAEARSAALTAAADAIDRASAGILAANARDMATAGTLTEALRERLFLDPGRVAAIARGVREIAAQDDPVGRIDERWTRPNGLDFARVRVPLGVIGVIYESRPNVTADAGALCLRAGNAAILRGGSESFHSSAALLACLRQGLAAAGLPEDAVQALGTTDRAAVGALLAAHEHLDLVVPRGGKGLIERVQREARVPVLAHLDGNCHVYVDRAANPDVARRVVVNAKMRRVSVCGAAETLLVDRAAPAGLLAMLVDDLIQAGCAVRGDADVRAVDARVTPADDTDWATEYLDRVIAARVVDGVDEAIAHVERWGSRHTDAIITEDAAAADRFLAELDSAILLLNASTQYADGGEFGFGAEVGIATGRLHARGPVGARHLTTWKYVVRGTGQVRP
jgi:glutamate-5-semialdehyde dehydrogenase